MHKSLLIFIFSSFSLSGFSQTNWCAQTRQEQLFLEQNPGLIPFVQQKQQELEEKAEQDLYSKQMQGVVYTIPVVFHILHENGEENISNEQVRDAMRILNEDFRKNNADISNVIAQFASIAADCEIEFKLAQKDPQGNCTNGINRYFTPLTNDAGENSKINIWPRDKYLNIWVVNNIDNGGGAGVTLGYTFTPSVASFQPAKDGIMLWHQAVGTIGTSSTDGKTLTHEVGHWINLQHIWGTSNTPAEASNCNGDDGVSDTPNCIGNPSGCNTASTTCGSLDNVQNFLNYASCSHMFTNGQASRMRSALTSSTAQRNNLWSAANLAFTGTDGNDELCLADFRASSNVACLNDTFFVYDESYHGPNFWTWTAELANHAYYNANGQIIFENLGESDVTLEVSNGTNTLSITKEDIVRVISNEGEAAPASEGFENQVIPSQDWGLTDFNGDGVTWENNNAVGYQSSSCVWIDNFSNTQSGATEVLTSPLYDLANMTFASVQFRVAYARKQTTDQDRLKVYFSNDCGKNWILKFNRAGNSLASFSNPSQVSVFSPTTDNNWSNFNFSLSGAELTQSAVFKFEFVSDLGNNIYLDNFNIEGSFSDDVVLANPANTALLQDYSVTLDWKASFNPVDEYEYQFDEDPLFNSASLQQGTKTYIGYDHYDTDTEYDVVGTLAKNVSYYWRVRTITGGIPSAWSDTWSFMVDPSLSSQNIFETENSFTIFPNPTLGKTSILFDLKGQKSYTLAVYNLLGKKTVGIFKNKILSGNTITTFDTENLSEGVYLIKLSSPEGSLVKKLIVNK